MTHNWYEISIYLLYEFLDTLDNVFVQLDGFDCIPSDCGHFSFRDGRLHFHNGIELKIQNKKKNVNK